MCSTDAILVSIALTLAPSLSHWTENHPLQAPISKTVLSLRSGNFILSNLYFKTSSDNIPSI
jgi:hypothetical protein